MKREAKGKAKKPRPSHEPAPVASASAGGPVPPTSTPIPAAPDPPAHSHARPQVAGGNAPEILAALRERLFDLLPGWAGRPEDPANVLLEVVAEVLARLRGDLSGDEERRALQLLDRLGFEPRPPRPARGAVVFTARASVLQSGGAVVVPAGAEIVLARKAGGDGPAPPRVVFETVSPTRVGSARLARALAVDGVKLRDLPCGSPPGVGVPAAGDSGGSGGVAAFGSRLGAGRELFLGDESFLSLRSTGGSLRLEWPGYPRELSGAIWEYGVEGGWRGLPVRFERTAGNTPSLAMRIEGPLPDLVQKTHLRAEFPWIRCRLSACAVDLAAPLLLAAPATGRTGGREERRRLARVILADGEETADFSFDPRLEAPLPHAEVHAAVYLGWDGPSASTAFLALEDDSGAEAVAPPRFAWESSAGGGWAALDPTQAEDLTRGLTRSGSLTLAPSAGWEPRDLFGERLWWVRGRWISGERSRPVVVKAILPQGAEVLQGRTVRDLVLARASEIEGSELVLPSLAEGETDAFDRLEFRGQEESAQVWHRVSDLAACGPGDPCFALLRGADGRWRIRFGDGARGRLPPVDGSVVVPVLRVGIGSQGNLPAGALSVLAADLPGIESVENPLPTRGGEDAESAASLRARASAEWRTGGRAVTAADIDCLARGRVRGLERAAAAPDPRRPGGLLVVLIPERPREPGRFPPALLSSIEADLAARAPLGTPLRVVEPSYLPVEVEVSLEPRPADLEGFRAILHAAIESYLDPVRGGVRGQGFPGRGGLAEDALLEKLEPHLERGVRLLSARILDREGKPLPFSSTDWPPDLVLRLSGVRVRGE